MAGIDEKEEYDETSHGTNNSGRMGGTLVSSSRASHVKNYDFQSHYTPSQSSKRMMGIQNSKVNSAKK
jgi:hypothetical protein